MSGFEGTFSVTVWPVYIGASMAAATPPFTISEPHNGGYQRGTIHWYVCGPEHYGGPRDGSLVGRARITLPPAIYTHFVYFHHPVAGQCCGVAKMDHPLKCTDPLTYLDVDPITNNDLALLEARG